MSGPISFFLLDKYISTLVYQLKHTNYCVGSKEKILNFLQIKSIDLYWFRPKGREQYE